MVLMRDAAVLEKPTTLSGLVTHGTSGRRVKEAHMLRVTYGTGNLSQSRGPVKSRDAGGVQRGKATQRAKLLRATPDQPFWQYHYYEQVIRNRFELDRIREHIASNPL
jgi:hypothetical protein